MKSFKNFGKDFSEGIWHFDNRDSEPVSSSIYKTYPYEF